MLLVTVHVLLADLTRKVYSEQQNIILYNATSNNNKQVKLVQVQVLNVQVQYICQCTSWTIHTTLVCIVHDVHTLNETVKIMSGL